MTHTIFQTRIAAAAFLLAAFHPVHAHAESETVDGLTVRIDMVGKESNARAPLAISKSASLQPLQVSLSNADNGKPILDAVISLAVRNPRGQHQKKALTRSPDGQYSGAFMFDASGQYLVTVYVLKSGQGEPFEAIFSERVP